MKNYSIDDEIEGKVSGITKYGIFLKIDDEYDGMIHISEISDKFVVDLEKMFVLGESVVAKILDVDYEKKQLKLTIKEYNLKNNRNKQLREEGRGFEPLSENLEKWVKEKIKEIENNKKNNKI